MYTFNNLNAHNKYDILKSKDMLRAEAEAVKRGISEDQLMESAGLKVVLAIKKYWKRCRVIILCGPGNNGGDGFVVARLLLAQGWPVKVLLLNDVDKIKGVASRSLQKFLNSGGNAVSINKDQLPWGDLFVDAFFGSGLSRNLDNKILEIFSHLMKLKLPIISIDIPSGINCDTGSLMGGAIRSDLTVTFFRPKRGHFLLPGKDFCGDIIVDDIGIPDDVLKVLDNKTFLNNLDKSKFIKKSIKDHKYKRGHSIIFGAHGMSGASILAAQAARRIGAGMVTIVAPEKTRNIYISNILGSVFRPSESFFHFEKFESNLVKIKPNSIIIGPGFGDKVLLKEIIQNLSRIMKPIPNIVLDADALTCFEGDLDNFIQVTRNMKSKIVITPHEGEFYRLFGEEFKKFSKPDAVMKASFLSNATIVLKGNDTIIADSTSEMYFSYNAPLNLATAGSGDVLAGIIGGLIAQGMIVLDACRVGVWVHNNAGNLIGKSLIAEDIISILPDVT
ncbi:MAG: hypothetical protein CBC47_00765 [Alphaproteobacteria bacterium TMED87]|nr:bifunctional ADP-dependent NAD(P)H-hydrate dehydratase/NAD(P)H-hydrate epimerase [Rhodospirillaceae bacterium]OUV11890.1 MAG: hypothetical protein CBC47_00765 [Alphaproteobacteria bacterium TMED87]